MKDSVMIQYGFNEEPDSAKEVFDTLDGGRNDKKKDSCLFSVLILVLHVLVNGVMTLTMSLISAHNQFII